MDLSIQMAADQEFVEEASPLEEPLFGGTATLVLNGDEEEEGELDGDAFGEDDDEFEEDDELAEDDEFLDDEEDEAFGDVDDEEAEGEEEEDDDEL
jgi:hypothetical protein